MQTGKVIIAGAGPGDPDLLTLKAARYLQQADVILADRLVSRDILRDYAAPGAQILFVGKEGGSYASVSQRSINELLVTYARKSRLVVRLKGGDVAFFSNVLDELQTLKAHGIPYEIIPGITAASGASAYTGVPLTARGYADSVRFLTYFNKEDRPDDYWAELATTDDTLVFYMSGAGVPALARALAARGISEDKEVMIVAQATTPYQQVSLYRISELSGLEEWKYLSPTLVVVGKVTVLHRQFGWRDNTVTDSRYFAPAQNR